MAEFFSLQTTLQYFLRFWLRVNWCGEYWSWTNWKALVLKEGCLKTPMGLIKQLIKSYIHYLCKVRKGEYVMIKSCLFIHTVYISLTQWVSVKFWESEVPHWKLLSNFNFGLYLPNYVNLKLNSTVFNVACIHGTLCYFNNRHFTFL